MKFREIICEKKAGDMSAQEIKDMIKKTFPKASDEEFKLNFKKVYSHVTHLPHIILNPKTIKKIINDEEK